MGFLVFVIGILLALWAQWRVKSSFQSWSQVPSRSGMTGKEVARRILDQHGLSTVRIEPIQGFLSDHYDPTQRVVRLS